jgi:hypothetical protein
MHKSLLTDRFTDENLLIEIQSSMVLSRLYEKFDRGGPQAFALWWASLSSETQKNYRLGV